MIKTRKIESILRTFGSMGYTDGIFLSKKVNVNSNQSVLTVIPVPIFLFLQVLFKFNSLKKGLKN